MDKKDAVAQILFDRFANVYCDTCVYNKEEEGNCDECHRKSMNWGISIKYAERVADEILKILEANNV